MASYVATNHNGAWLANPDLTCPAYRNTSSSGNNRLLCFLDDDDHHRYRTLLREALLATEHTAAYRAPLPETLFDELLQEIRVYLQQQRAESRS